MYCFVLFAYHLVLVMHMIAYNIQNISNMIMKFHIIGICASVFNLGLLESARQLPEFCRAASLYLRWPLLVFSVYLARLAQFEVSEYASDFTV